MQHVRDRNEGDGTQLTTPCNTENLSRPHVGTSIVYGMGGGVDTLGGQVSDLTTRIAFADATLSSHFLQILRVMLNSLANGRIQAGMCRHFNAKQHLLHDLL
jgi:hypothetical protein